jgi:hypothetical protein
LVNTPLGVFDQQDTAAPLHTLKLKRVQQHTHVEQTPREVIGSKALLLQVVVNV